MYLEIFFFLNSDYFYLKTTPNFTLQKHFKNTPNNNLKYDKIWKNLNMTINIVPTEPIKDYSITISINIALQLFYEDFYPQYFLPPLFQILSYSPFLLCFSRWSCDRTTSNVSIFLTLSWRRPVSYRNQSIDLRSKSMNWFLYDIGLRHERVKNNFFVIMDLDLSSLSNL